MKTLNLFPALLATLALLTSATHGQTAGDVPKSVTEARCQYIADSACAKTSSKPADENSDTVAQMPRRAPGPPMRPGRYPRAYPSYPPPMWAGDGHRTAIGALIGLGIGGAVGAALPSHPQSSTRVLGGLIFGGLGACFGAAVAKPIFALHARGRHPAFPSSHPGDQDELASRRNQSPASQSAQVAAANDPHSTPPQSETPTQAGP